MCVNAEYISSKWMPLSKALFKFWRIKRVKKANGYVGSMEREYIGWIAYVQSYPHFMWFKKITYRSMGWIK